MIATMQLNTACLHNIADTTPADDGSLRLSRLPLSLLPHVNLKAQQRAFAPAGAELRFRLHSPLRLTLRRCPDHNAAFAPPAAVLAGVFYGDFQQGWYALPPGDTDITIAPPSSVDLLRRHRVRFDPELVRVVLPVFPETRLLSLEGNYDVPRAADAPSRTYLAYGSSITHGAHTPLGTETYPALIARALGADLCNLGLGGGAALEPQMADWLVSRNDWHAASLEMGINITPIDPAEFRARVRRFLAPFAAQPRPIVCLDLLPFKDELDGTRASKVAEFRRVVAEEVARVGVPHIRHLPYASALGPVANLSSDLLHPSAGGFFAIAHNLLKSLESFPQFLAALK